MIRSKRLVIGGIALATAAFVSGTFVGVSSAQTEAEMKAEEQAMMQKYMEYAAPGPEHAKLAKQVGKWNLKITMWNYEGAEPSESTGTAVIEPVLGGRFFAETVKSTFDMGGHEMPFEGRNLMGYDNLQDHYFYVWCDTFMSGVVTGKGNYDRTGKILTYFSDDAPDAMKGELKKVKSVAREISDDKHVFEWHEKNADGKWWKMMEIVYTRAG